MTPLATVSDFQSVIQTEQQYAIRLIQPQDNAAVRDIITYVLREEFGFRDTCYAWADPETQAMYEAYRHPESRYFVVEDTETGEVLGGGGFSRLKRTRLEDGICELQKLYFLPKTRGLGLGKAMLTHCLEQARQLGYQKMYLESTTKMMPAITLYRRYGFEHVDKPLGDTGHFACDVHMLRDL